MLHALALLSLAGASVRMPSRNAQDAGHPDRTTQLVTALHRSGAVPRCWNQFLASTPEAGSVHFRVRVEVNAGGSVATVTVLDPAPQLLVTCVRSELRQASVPAGAAATVETTYGFAAGTPAPVPTPDVVGADR